MSYQPTDSELEHLGFTWSAQNGWEFRPKLHGRPGPIRLYYVPTDREAYGLIRDEGSTARLLFRGCSLSKRGFWEVLTDHGGYPNLNQ